MLLKKIFYIYLLTIIFIINIYSDQTDDTITVKSIKYEGIKVTKSRYLDKILPIKEGDIWNEDTKKNLERKLKKIDDIVQAYNIIEQFNYDNTVSLTIQIDEKTSFIVIPFATYSNSDGVKPQIKLFHFNVGGYRKFIKSELEFHPKDSMNLIFKYKDREVANLDNLSYELEGAFKTSVINYYANVDYYGNPRNIAPIGVIGGDTTEKWNDELFILGELSFDLSYVIPIVNVEVNPSFYFKYKDTLDKDESDVTPPIHEFELSNGMNFNIPIKKIRADINPGFNIENNITVSNNKGYNSFKPKAFLYLQFNIPVIQARITPYIIINYSRSSEYYFAKAGEIDTTTLIIGDTLDLKIGLEFHKAFSVRNFNHIFDVAGELKQRLIGGSVDNILKDFKTAFDFSYEFEASFLKKHAFKMKLTFFARYNQTEELSGYDIGDEPGDLEGWIGAYCNLKYELPIFSVDTPKIATFKMKKRMLWQVFWDFYIDFGFVLNNEENDYTLDKNYLHLQPALGVGTSIRVLPDFVPVEIRLDVGADLYQIIKDRNISGDSIILKFFIEEKF